MNVKFSINPAWDKDTLAACLPMILALSSFVTYWFIAQSERIRERFYQKYDFDKASYRHIFFTKVSGFVLMGIFPLAFCLIFFPENNLAAYGLTFVRETTFFSFAWIFGLTLLVIPLTFFSARKEKNHGNYPQIRSRVWTVKILLIDALGWFLYLLGYELLFRGVLLFPMADSLGIWPAIVFNVVFYSATHIPKGLDETIGAIPLGLVLCILTLYSGTIWIAFWVHVFMAWTNSFTALSYHREIKFRRS